MDKPVVLILEDEAVIRMGAIHIVEDAGFAVVEARNADEAIEILERRRDIQAVFSDIRMSGLMDGFKLAHAIRGRWPPIHLLLTSGTIVPDDMKLPANSRFIRKPYSPEQIAAALRELFGTGPGSGRINVAAA